MANGQINHPHTARSFLKQAEYIIAADGGTHHCLKLGHNPDLVVGDLDSLNQDLIEGLRRASVRILQHPSHKDATDLELALVEAQELSAKQIFILGAVGGRWDQTLANFHLIASPRWYQQRIEIIDGPQRVFPIHAGQPFELTGEKGDLVSLIPVGGDARGIDTDGFEYTLQDGTLNYDNSRGTSNVLINPPGRICVRSGTLLCIVVRGGEEKILKSGES